MTSQRIVLAGLGPNLAGLIWETDRVLRIGRQASSDVVVNDASVDRHHAEIKHQGVRWVLRDLANNPIYPTAVNGAPLCGEDRALQPHDRIQIGAALFKVVHLVLDLPKEASTARGDQPCEERKPTSDIKASRMHLRVQAVTNEPWDRALELIGGSGPHANNATMLVLARTNRHLAHLAQPDELWQSILADALAAVRARRGSILLPDPATGELVLKATLAPSLRGGFHQLPYSQTLANRCYQAGESILCHDANADPALVLSRSIRHGAMASIICALLRTPQKRIGILHLDRGYVDEPFTESDLHQADAIAAAVAVSIDAARFVADQREQYFQAVSTLARAFESRDSFMGDSSNRRTDCSLLLADELQLCADEKYLIQIGSPLHDIGMIGIDDAILRKPGKLTAGEFEYMKTHTIKGATMLDAMRHFVPMIPIVRHHHERWDGTGYPDGLARDRIPLAARIVSVADAFAAMTSARPYRPALAPAQAFLELIARAGTHFDPACVYAFLRVRRKIEAMMR